MPQNGWEIMSEDIKSWHTSDSSEQTNVLQKIFFYSVILIQFTWISKKSTLANTFLKCISVLSITEAILVLRYILSTASFNDLNCGFNGGHLGKCDTLFYFISDQLLRLMALINHKKRKRHYLQCEYQVNGRESLQT